MTISSLFAAQWIDRSVETLIKRNFQPVLSISIPPPVGTRTQSSYHSPTSEELRAVLTSFVDMNIKIDRYPVHLGLSSESKDFNAFAGRNGNASGNGVVRLLETRHYCGVSILGSDKLNSQFPPPFAIIGPSLNADPLQEFSIELFVLPFDFVQFIALMKQAKDVNLSTKNTSNLTMATIGKKSLTSDWHGNWNRYIQSIPMYYHPVMYKILKPFGLHHTIPTNSNIAGNPSFHHIFSRTVHKALTKLRNSTLSALLIIEAFDRSRNCIADATSSDDANLSDTDSKRKFKITKNYYYDEYEDIKFVADYSGIEDNVETSVSTVANHTLPLYRFLSNIYEHQLIEPEHLMLVWEKSRTAIYGKTGLTVKGIFVAGIASTAGSFVSKVESGRDWFFRGCGGAISAHVPVGISTICTLL